MMLIVATKIIKIDTYYSIENVYFSWLKYLIRLQTSMWPLLSSSESRNIYFVSLWAVMI